MDENLITKKELLELTGISYGALYRWKRMKLLPDDWFIHRSTFTGHETFFPRDKVLARVREIQELINPDLQVIGVLATLHDTRVTDDREILGLLKEEYNLLGVVKRLAVAKKGIYDGLAVVEQAPNSEIAAEYKAVAEMIISGKMKREEQCHG